jgi:hypothetical protein
MGILDEAIREHLELKRQHGAEDSELQQLEDEAFGQPERPGAEAAASDPFAEAPTEFMAAPQGDDAPAAEPAAEEPPAIEHEVVSEAPGPPAGPTTEERHAIAEQPTELFDIEGEIAASDSTAPSDEELVEEEIVEPRLAPVDPLAGLEEAEAGGEVEVSAVDDEDEDDFFDEQRLSDELDQALEAPVEEAPEAEEAVEAEEADEEEIVESLAMEDEDEGEQDEGELAPDSTEPGGVIDRDREDVLEDTPDFLEDSEDDELWFEQKPPKDFDFDD